MPVAIACSGSFRSPDHPICTARTVAPEKLSPERPIQRPILNRLRNVLAFDLRIGIKIGDGPRDLQDAVVGTGAQTLLLHSAFQHALAVRAQIAIGAYLARAHLRVRIDAFPSGS